MSVTRVIYLTEETLLPSRRSAEFDPFSLSNHKIRTVDIQDATRVVVTINGVSRAMKNRNGPQGEVISSDLAIEAGRIYVDVEGFVHGPMARDGDGPTFSAGGPMSWLSDGSGGDSDALTLVRQLFLHPQVHPDLHAQLLDAERRCEATHDAVCTALRVLCEAAGLRVPEGKGYDFPVLFGLIHEWVQAAPNDPDFAEVVPPTSPDPTDGGYYTTVLVPTEKLGEISYALSDLACWARGFRAALPRNEFGVASEDAPMGTWAVTEINIALKRALEKNA